jgi:hypothetical protein
VTGLIIIIIIITTTTTTTTYMGSIYEFYPSYEL